MVVVIPMTEKQISLSFMHQLILYCLHAMNGERSIYAIFHILNGKKSSQTIQDVKLFRLEPFFNTYKNFSRKELEEIVSDLEKEQLITEKELKVFQLTTKGKETAKQFLYCYPFLNDLNGWKYPYDWLFWQRFTLFVQVISNSIYGEKSYLPIQKNKEVQRWVKTVLLTLPFSREQLGRKLYDELVSALKRNEYMSPAVLVSRLTGYKSIGITKEQACELFQMEKELYHYQFISYLHYLIRTIEENKMEFPLLFLLIKDLQHIAPLTMSARKTYTLMQKGYSMEEIAKIRNLKVSTIQDHIVEMALNLENFQIETFVNEEKRRKIVKAVKCNPTKQLKYIKQQVNEASYFEIRLVIARLKNEHEYR